MTDVSPNVLKSLSNRSPQKANSLQQILGFADQEAESSNYVGTYFPRIFFCDENKFIKFILGENDHIC